MAFRFVPLSSQKIAAPAANSPLRKAVLVTADSNISTGHFFVGLLRVYRVSAACLAVVRQEPVLLSPSGLGLYIPTDREVYDYAGVHLQSKTDAKESVKGLQPVLVEFHPFDEKLVTVGHLDLVRNLMTNNQWGMQYWPVTFL